MTKPQIKHNISDFDNDITVPWIPKIKEKNNALVPMPNSIIEAQKDKNSFINEVFYYFLIN